VHSRQNSLPMQTSRLSFHEYKQLKALQKVSKHSLSILLELRG